MAAFFIRPLLYIITPYNPSIYVNIHISSIYEILENILLRHEFYSAIEVWCILTCVHSQAIISIVIILLQINSFEQY